MLSVFGWKMVRTDKATYGSFGTLQHEIKIVVVPDHHLRGAFTMVNRTLTTSSLSP